MRVFYFCSTGAGPSVIAAAIHLGLLSPDKPPQAGELEALLRLGRRYSGRVNLVGTDDKGNEIYTFGLGKEKGLLKKTVTDFIKLYHKEKEYLLVDTCYAENRMVRWGRFLPGKGGLFLCSRGFRKEYQKLACTVHHTLHQLSRYGHP